MIIDTGEGFFLICDRCQLPAPQDDKKGEFEEAQDAALWRDQWWGGKNICPDCQRREGNNVVEYWDYTAEKRRER